MSNLNYAPVEPLGHNTLTIGTPTNVIKPLGDVRSNAPITGSGLHSNVLQPGGLHGHHAAAGVDPALEQKHDRDHMKAQEKYLKAEEKMERRHEKQHDKAIRKAQKQQEKELRKMEKQVSKEEKRRNKEMKKHGGLATTAPLAQPMAGAMPLAQPMVGQPLMG